MLLERLRQELAARGARGFIGIQRKFRIIDDDGDQRLSIGEFTKAMRETDLNFSLLEINALFKLIDTDQSGTIDFEEFLMTLRVRNVFETTEYRHP